MSFLCCIKNNLVHPMERVYTHWEWAAK